MKSLIDKKADAANKVVEKAVSYAEKNNLSCLTLFSDEEGQFTIFGVNGNGLKISIALGEALGQLAFNESDKDNEKAAFLNISMLKLISQVAAKRVLSLAKENNTNKKKGLVPIITKKAGNS